MEIRKKIVINTIVLYIKLITKIFLVMFSTRIVLRNLGIEDFGLYNLIAGVIALLSFLNSAMMSSTQRFLSVEMGKGSFLNLRAIFASSMTIHVLIGLIISTLLFILMPFFFNGVLSIPQEKIEIASSCYIIMIFNILITLITIPFNAAINSHEDMWFFAIIEIVCEIMKLCSAYLLYFVISDRLIIYCHFLLGVTIWGALAKIFWSYLKYKEITINLFKYSTKSYLNKMVKFVSWNSLGALSQVFRNQGVAVVLNMFFGVIVNAAYAVTNQVNSALLSFSQIMTSTLAPQIMKSKGENNKERMIFISVLASKLSFLLASVFVIFLLVDLSLILQTWLSDVPTETIDFCEYTIWIFLVMELYPGLVRMIQANGVIRNYQIVTSFLLILVLPISYILFELGLPPVTIFQVMLILQIFALVSTLYFSNKLCGLNIKKYVIKTIFMPISIFICLMGISQMWYACLSHGLSNLLLVGLSSNVVYLIAFYIFILDTKEKLLVLNILKIKK